MTNHEQEPTQIYPEQALSYAEIVDKSLIQPSGDKLTVAVFEVDMAFGYRVELDSQQPENPIFGTTAGKSPIAQIELGGQGDIGAELNGSTRVNIIAVGPTGSQDLKAIEEKFDAKQGGVIFATSEEVAGNRTISGFSYLPPEGGGVIGRVGNLKWLDEYGNSPSVQGWTPFKDNDTVSREHVGVSLEPNGKLIIENLSRKGAVTKLSTRANPSHEKAVKKLEAEKLELRGARENQVIRVAEKTGRLGISRLRKR